MLHPIELPSHINTLPIPPSIADQLALMRSRIEAFHDRWDQHQAEQFVAADYELVYQTLVWLQDHQPTIGRRFVEWGCGFAAVCCLADQLGWNAHGIEAHPDLIPQATQTIASWPAQIDLCTGNFLPAGAEELAFDPTLPSLGHSGQSAYDLWGLELDDFALVYSYPWPGEDEFHEDVFDRYAAVGALLLMFIGPNEMRLWRKVKRD
ncbi:class I SAM-dependent methyltransferase [Stieleria tagensis]|uniref:class I SAM-dependent methyltransferase n=1 Tax=Stieleria tagensis TaxID=2956795 RepID=UPI00209B98B1|nr:class I SAM-dependent methyltransferase [Stieleria tagensis]